LEEVYLVERNRFHPKGPETGRETETKKEVKGEKEKGRKRGKGSSAVQNSERGSKEEVG